MVDLEYKKAWEPFRRFRRENRKLFFIINKKYTNSKQIVKLT